VYRAILLKVVYAHGKGGVVVDERAQYWLELADYDIETARIMLSGKRYLYVGFMCHQTIEKAIKAVIARDCAEGEIPPKIHHLLKLADRAGLWGKMSARQQVFIKELNPMNIEARYPEYKEAIAAGLTAGICGNLLAGTEELLCWIKEQL
jgi:HEPN domain-containing protein